MMTLIEASLKAWGESRGFVCYSASFRVKVLECDGVVQVTGSRTFETLNSRLENNKEEEEVTEPHRELQRNFCQNVKEISLLYP